MAIQATTLLIELLDAGNPIANRDLMEKAIRLEQKIEEHGSVTYHTFDVSDMYTAKELANTGCDTAQDLYDMARRHPYRSFTTRKLYHLTEDSD